VTSAPDVVLVTARADAARVVDDLRRELEAIGESTRAPPDDEHDAEGSTVGYERARVAALLHVAEATLARLDRAIERRHDAWDGRCTGCGEEIDAERVLALPGVDRCTACARASTARPALGRTCQSPDAWAK
jgi:DnaK suppressor protein